jgi:hypothetical protein
MNVRIIRLTAAVTLTIFGSVAVPRAASAADGTFAWTKITTPAATFTYNFDASAGAVNHLDVSGTAIQSADVTTLNIVCVIGSFGGTGLTQIPLATNVPVVNGTFHVTATLPGAPGICRLRALPTNLDPSNPYLGSFAGPLMYTYSFDRVKDGNKTVAFAAENAVGTGAAIAGDPSVCGVAALGTVVLPEVQQRGPAAQMCYLGLHHFAINGTDTPTASGIRVDGNNAYLPGSVFSYLRDAGHLGLALNQPAVTVSFSRNSVTGVMTVTSSARLWRCSGSNLYPPTAESCPSVVNTGVTFKQVLEIVQGAHQVILRHSYVSNDGQAHIVRAQYQNVVARGSYGAPGYIYPQHSSSFRRASFEKVVTGFGTGAGTVYVRSDIFATSDDPQADTQALTWSRPPAAIRFDHQSVALFAMRYTFHVPTTGAAKIAFALSEAPTTAAAKTLAAKAVAAF